MSHPQTTKFLESEQEAKDEEKELADNLEDYHHYLYLKKLANNSK